VKSTSWFAYSFILVAIIYAPINLNAQKKVLKVEPGAKFIKGAALPLSTKIST
jgi:hypothetical protein